MDSELKTKIYLLIIILFVIFLSLKVLDLKEKINDLEERQLQVNEYILNRIGG